jgi:hypothetical protein
VLTGLCRLADQLAVVTGWGGDHNRIDLTVAEYHPVVDRTDRDSELLGPTVIEMRACNSPDHRLRNVANEVFGVHPADAACSDHADVRLVHRFAAPDL